MRRHLAMVCWHRTASETGRHTAHMSTAECHVQAYDQELRWNELMQTRWTRQDSHELHMHVHTQLFNGPLSGTTRVSCYQKIHSPTFSIYMPDSPFPSPLWSTSWSGTLYVILHTFLHPISIFIHVRGSSDTGIDYWSQMLAIINFK